jgi:hypothetical protein
VQLEEDGSVNIMEKDQFTELKVELTKHIEREQQLREDVSELKTDMGCVKRSIFQVKWLVIGALCATMAMQSGASAVIAKILVGI